MTNSSGISCSSYCYNSHGDWAERVVSHYVHDIMTEVVVQNVTLRAVFHYMGLLLCNKLIIPNCIIIIIINKTYYMYIIFGEKF